MKILKKIMPVIFVTIIVSGIVYFQNDIIEYILKAYSHQKENVVYEANAYYKNVQNNFVQETENFTPTNKQEILNIIYTLLNFGIEDFKFNCERTYTNCLDDVSEITQTSDILSTINNFLHPYNSYHKVNISANNLGEIRIVVNKLHSSNEITYLEEEINKIIADIIKSEMDIRTKILTFHDYIINKTKYDSDFAKTINQDLPNTDFSPNKASGLLKNHLAICSGYADTMAIFLNKLGIPNYKIANETHVWNYVLIDGKWLHLDLTWDDPVTDTGEDILIHDYFLITTVELHNNEAHEHHFDKGIFEK